MKNKVNYPNGIITTGIITAVMVSVALQFFYKSNFVVSHSGTTEGALIAGIGGLLITVVATAISITSMLLIRKYQKKNEK